MGVWAQKLLFGSDLEGCKSYLGCLLLSDGDETLEFLERVQHEVDLCGGLLRFNGLDHQELLVIFAEVAIDN
jgi:hypothetical protein